MTLTTRSRASLGALLALALTVPLATAPAHADTAVEVSAVVKGESAPTTPLADVAVTVLEWDALDDQWVPVVSMANDDATDEDGRFTLVLEAGRTYTVRLTAPTGYPAQHLGGGAAPPAGPAAADWPVATFEAGGSPSLPATITLSTTTTTSVAGTALGDEDGTSPEGWAELYELSRIEDGPVADTLLGPDGGYTFHELRTGSTYAVRVSVDGYLPTYLGDTTQPELAAWFPAGSSTALEPVTLRRGASVTGTVVYEGEPVDLVEVTALRWDAAGARWLTPVHFGGEPTFTEDGEWSLSLEPGATYTLFLGTQDAAGVPESQFLGGSTTPPDPSDPDATFTLAPAGTDLEVSLLEPPVEEPPVEEPPVEEPPVDEPPVEEPPTEEPPAQGTTTTTLALSAPSAPFGAKVRATVTVRATAGTPDGPVTLLLDGTKLTTVTPDVSGRSATVTVSLPRKLKTGRHRLEARTAASATAAGSRATGTLRITKAKAKVTVKGPKRWRLKAGKRPTVTVKVKGTKGGPKAQGKVTVRFGKKKVTKRLKAGKVKVRGPRQRTTGKVKVTVRYAPKAKTYAKPKVVKKTLKVR